VFQRLSLIVVISALVPGIVALGTEAKHSQYYSNKGAIQYLSKATKMDTCRTPGSASVPPTVVAESRPLDTPLTFTAILWTSGPARPSPRSLRLEVRPPPTAS